MTARAPVLACVTVLAFFAGITGVRLAYSLAYALVFLLIASFAWSRIAARRIKVTRESPEGSYMVGEPFVERFSVTNASVLPIPYCEVHDGTRLPGYVPGRAFSLAAGGVVAWSARGKFTRRGLYGFGPLEARLGDPFGLFQRTVSLSPRHQVLVLPRIHGLGELSPLTSGAAGGGDGRSGRPIDLPPDVSTVREYDVHDGLGRIHWLSTARTGRLMSRVYDTRQSTDVLVLLDLEAGHHAGTAPESSLEYAISIAASVVHAGIRRGQAVGLVTNDRAQTAIGAGRGEAQRLRMLHYLAVAADDGSTRLADVIARHGEMWRGRGGIVVISSSRDRSWVEALIEVGVRGTRHLAVLVDPTSFGAPGTPMRIAPSWRLAVDWWLVRRGDDLDVGGPRSAAASF